MLQKRSAGGGDTPAPRNRIRAALLTVVLLVAACTSSTSATNPRASPTVFRPPASSRSSATGRLLTVVALGDSIPAGRACSCTPFPQLTAARLAATTRRPVRAVDDAVSGYTTDDVLGQLDHNGTVISDLGRANLVEIEIGANDVAPTRECGIIVGCYAAEVPQVETNLETIVQRVRQLAAHQALVVLLDYWSVWLGGKYASARGPAYVRAAALVTDEVNTVIRGVATKDSAVYVDLRAAFKGANYDGDETPYLASDGVHPNVSGHQRIAAALIAVTQARLHLPA